MYLVINKCVTAVKVSHFSDHYLRNRSTLDISVLGYIGIVQRKEHSPEILSIPPGTPCIWHDYWTRFIEHKNVFIFHLQICLKHFILRRIQQDIIINVRMSPRAVPVFLVRS